MLRICKLFDWLRRKQQPLKEHGEEYKLTKFSGVTKRKACKTKRRQQEITLTFLKTLEMETQECRKVVEVMSSIVPPNASMPECGKNDLAADSNKLATFTPTLDHFKCIAETTHKNDNDKHQENDAHEAKYDTFLCATRPILLLAQWCGGLMPVSGVFQANATQLHFSCKSLPMVLTLWFLLCSSLISLGYLKHLTIIDVDAKNIVGLVFFSCVQLACILFLTLAVRWPKLMLMWSRIEHIFTRPPYAQPKRKLAARLRFAALVIICCSLVEHSLYLTSSAISYMRKQHLCANGVMSFDDFIHKNYSYVFTLLPYHPTTGIFILLTNGVCTFVWNYMDLFIMMVSKGIAYRFEQITMRINQLADKEVSEEVFTEIREHYVLVCELLEQVDDHLSGLILLSNLNNLYFVCTQLLNIFNKLRWPINYIYFWYSLLYLIGRAAFVFLCAATINDESKGALSVLRRVPQKTWCIEVERLIFQMATQTVALTGKKFYFLTRTLLFSMAGTIVTYELVLLQFDEPNRVKGLIDLCAT